MNNKVKKVPVDEPVKLAVYDALGQVRVDVPSDEVDGGTVVWIDPSTASICFALLLASRSPSAQPPVDSRGFAKESGVQKSH